MENYYCIVTFHTTNHALTFEKAMKENEIDVKLMPVPRQVSSSCGTAAQFPCNMKREIVKICEEQHIEIDEVLKIFQKESSSLLSKLFKASK